MIKLPSISACFKLKSFKCVAEYLGISLLLLADISLAAGSSVANKNIKIFKELIVEGERPEISSCLTVALQSVKIHPAYSKINWEPEMSASAVVKEYQLSGTLIKEISLNAMALVRDQSFLHLDKWTTVSINCQQINEGKPTLNIMNREN